MLWSKHFSKVRRNFKFLHYAQRNGIYVWSYCIECTKNTRNTATHTARFGACYVYLGKCCEVRRAREIRAVSRLQYVTGVNILSSIKHARERGSQGKTTSWALLQIHLQDIVCAKCWGIERGDTVQDVVVDCRCKVRDNGKPSRWRDNGSANVLLWVGV